MLYNDSKQNKFGKAHSFLLKMLFYSLVSHLIQFLDSQATFVIYEQREAPTFAEHDSLNLLSLLKIQRNLSIYSTFSSNFVANPAR